MKNRGALPSPKKREKKGTKKVLNASLPFRNKTLIIKAKNYPKAHIKFYWSSQILL